MGRRDGAQYAVDNFWKHDVRQPENMLRVVKYYGFDEGEHGWNEWYKKNKTTKTPMECSLRLLLMKALNANRGMGLNSLDGSPIEGLHRTHAQAMARGGTLVDWDKGHYKSASSFIISILRHLDAWIL